MARNSARNLRQKIKRRLVESTIPKLEDIKKDMTVLMEVYVGESDSANDIAAKANVTFEMTQMLIDAIEKEIIPNI